jgi:lipoprotein-anchoring transpeptidase ErfK/SrfK
MIYRLALAVAVALAAVAATAEATASAGCDPARVLALRSPQVAYVATALRPLNAFRAPGQRVMIHFRKRNANGVRTVFGVLGARVDRSCAARWYVVQVPAWPNGQIGWIRAQDVSVRRVRARIEVDLSARRVRLFRDGRPMLSAVAAIGAASTPTPTGSFYVNQRFVTRNPLGVFGPRIVGVSAFSPVLRSWPQGGPVAIHGTNTPHELGFAVSHGCIRVRNNEVLRIYREAREGTPVEIRM